MVRIIQSNYFKISGCVASIYELDGLDLTTRLLILSVLEGATIYHAALDVDQTSFITAVSVKKN